VRANPTAALTVWNFRWRLIDVVVLERRAAAYVASALEEFPVHMDDIVRSRLLVQVVHVLRAEEQAIPQGAFEFRKREVRRLGLAANATCRRIE
jgi:hypothetical protein